MGRARGWGSHFQRAMRRCVAFGIDWKRLLVPRAPSCAQLGSAGDSGDPLVGSTRTGKLTIGAASNPYGLRTFPFSGLSVSSPFHSFMPLRLVLRWNSVLQHLHAHGRPCGGPPLWRPGRCLSSGYRRVGPCQSPSSGCVRPPSYLPRLYAGPCHANRPSDGISVAVRQEHCDGDQRRGRRARSFTWKVTVPAGDVIGAVAGQLKKGGSWSRQALVVDSKAPGAARTLGG
jgi:hypothetical protein